MTESKEEFRGRPRWVRFALALQWLVIPALVFKGMSLGVKRWLPTQAKSAEAGFWRLRDQQVGKFKTIDCAFIGSSRVMAAVDEQVFAAELSKQLGREVSPLNLGLAYSTPQQQYLVLRNLFREHPEQMRGCTVFIEAPAGLPSDMREWQHPWFHPDRPDMLPSLLRPDDLIKVWSCGLPLEDRLAITKEFFCCRSSLLAQRTRIANAFVDTGNRLVHRMLDRFLPAAGPTAPAAAVDLTSRGGIRTDKEGVALARKLAVDLAKKPPPVAVPRFVTDRSVVADMVALVKRNGGRVVFFEMPMHSVQGGKRNDPGRAEDRRVFQEQIRAWNARFVPMTITTVDDDFPDIWHLRRSLAAPFSTSLAHGWADTLKREGLK